MRAPPRVGDGDARVQLLGVQQIIFGVAEEFGHLRRDLLGRHFAVSAVAPAGGTAGAAAPLAHSRGAGPAARSRAVASSSTSNVTGSTETP